MATYLYQGTKAGEGTAERIIPKILIILARTIIGPSATILPKGALGLSRDSSPLQAVLIVVTQHGRSSPERLIGRR